LQGNDEAGTQLMGCRTNSNSCDASKLTCNTEKNLNMQSPSDDDQELKKMGGEKC